MQAITLRPGDQSIIEDKLRTKKYTDPSAVVHEALSIFKDIPDSMDELTDKIDIGINQLDCGESAKWDAEEIKQHLKVQLSKNG